MTKERFKLTPAVHLFLVREEQILLLKRHNTGWENGKYSVVAGHVDGGEKATDAMTREAREEAGIDIKNPQLVHVMHRRSDADSERIDLFFITEDWDGKFENKEPHKCDDLKMFPIKDIPENMVAYVRSAIEQYMDGNIFSEFGW